MNNQNSRKTYFDKNGKEIFPRMKIIIGGSEIQFDVYGFDKNGRRTCNSKNVIDIGVDPAKSYPQKGEVKYSYYPLDRWEQSDIEIVKM